MNLFTKIPLLVVSILSAALIMNPHPVFAESKIKVAATSTFFADIVRQIGRDKVEVTAIASARFDAHFYEPTPKDIRVVRSADLYAHWGLDMEAWSDPLLEAAGRRELFRGGPGNVDLSQKINLLKVPDKSVSRSEGDVHLYGNPHYHMNPANLRVMAENIASKLASTHPGDSDYFQKNLAEFESRLDEKIEEWKTVCAHCRGREVIAYHDNMEYLASFLGLKINKFIEPKPGVPPTPRHLKSLEAYANGHRVQGIVVATYYPREAAERLAEWVGAKVITIAQNAGEVSGTESVFEFFDYNIGQISGALN